MARRILDETTKTTVASDDYLYMDGQTDGASKITPDNLVRNTSVAQQLSEHITGAEEEVEQITTDIEGIQTDLNDVKTNIGDLEELETTDKSSLVNAINEARGTGGGGSIDTLTDVELTNLSNGQALTYDSTDEVWKNVTLGGGGSITIDSALSNTSENPVQNKTITNALNGKADSSDLSVVATSGNYTDLINKPTIPTNTSDLTNDSGFITSAPVTSVNGQTGAVTGLQEAPIEVTIATSGAVTQALEPNKIYHFTSDALTALTVSSTAETPLEGRYEFDFISGATAPTVTMPSAWIMPNNFIVEPNGKYRLVVENGYCVANRWSDNNSPFTYVDVASGAFTLNTSGVTASNVYANIGTEVVSVTFSAVKNKAALDNNKRLRVCTISAETKQLIGGTYVTGIMLIKGSGLCTAVAFNTWDNSYIEIWNTTGASIAANTEFNGTIFILRTI